MTALAVLSAEQIIHDQAKTQGMVYEQASRHQVLQKRIAGLARFAFRSGTIDDGIEFFDRQIVLAAPPRRDLDPLLPRLCTHNRRRPRGQTARRDQRLNFYFGLRRISKPVRLVPRRQMAAESALLLNRQRRPEVVRRFTQLIDRHLPFASFGNPVASIAAQGAKKYADRVRRTVTLDKGRHLAIHGLGNRILARHTALSLWQKSAPGYRGDPGAGTLAQDGNCHIGHSQTGPDNQYPGIGCDFLQARQIPGV